MNMPRWKTRRQRVSLCTRKRTLERTDLKIQLSTVKCCVMCYLETLLWIYLILVEETFVQRLWAFSVEFKPPNKMLPGTLTNLENVSNMGDQKWRVPALVRWVRLCKFFYQHSKQRRKYLKDLGCHIVELLSSVESVSSTLGTIAQCFSWNSST